VDYVGSNYTHFVDVDLVYNANSANSTASTDISELYFKLYAKNENTRDTYKLIHNIRATAETDTNKIVINRRLDLGSYHDRTTNYQILLERDGGAAVTPTVDLHSFNLNAQFKYIQSKRYVGSIGYTGFQYNMWPGVSSFLQSSAPAVGDHYISLSSCKVYERVACDATNQTRPNGFVSPNFNYDIDGKQYAKKEESIMLRDSSGYFGKVASNSGKLAIEKYYASNIVSRVSLSIINDEADSQHDLFMYDIPIVEKSSETVESILNAVQKLNTSSCNVYRYFDFTIKEADYSSEVFSYDGTIATQIIDDDYQHGVWLVDKSNTQPLNNFTAVDDIDILTYLNNNLGVTREDKTFVSYNRDNATWSNVAVTDAVKVSNAMFKYNPTSNTAGYWQLTHINQDISETGVVGDTEVVMDPFLLSLNGNAATLDGVSILDLDIDIAKGFFERFDGYIDLPTDSFTFEMDFSTYMMVTGDAAGGARVKPYDNSVEDAPNDFADIQTGGGFSGSVVREFHRVDNDTWEAPTEWTVANRTSCDGPVYDKIRYTLTGGNATGYVRYYGMLMVISLYCGVDCCWDEVGKTDCGCCEKIDVPDCTNNGLTEWEEPFSDYLNRTMFYKNVPCKADMLSYKYPWSFVKSSNSTTSQYNDLKYSKDGWQEALGTNISIQAQTDAHVTYELQVPINISRLFINTQPNNTTMTPGGAANIKVEVSANTSSGFVDYFSNKQFFDDCGDYKVKYLRIRTANSAAFTLNSIYLEAKNCGPCCYESISTSWDLLEINSSATYSTRSYDVDSIYTQGDIVDYQNGTWASKTVQQSTTPNFTNSNSWVLVAGNSENLLKQPWTIQTTVFGPITPVSVGDGAAVIIIPETLDGKVIKNITANVIIASGNVINDTGNTKIMLNNINNSANLTFDPLVIGPGELGNIVSYPDITTAQRILTKNDYIRIDVVDSQTPPAQGLIITINGTASVTYSDPNVDD